MSELIKYNKLQKNSIIKNKWTLTMEQYFCIVYTPVFKCIS